MKIWESSNHQIRGSYLVYGYTRDDFIGYTKGIEKMKNEEEGKGKVIMFWETSTFTQKGSDK